MNTLDLLVVMAALAASVGGYRLGFLARVTSWVGMGLGAVVGDRISVSILDRIDAPSEGQALAIVVGTLLGCAFLGQALGLVVGQRLRHVLPFGGVRQADRVAGAGAGVLGVVLALWLLLPIMAEKSGWFAIQSRTSTLAEVVDERLPEPPNSALRRYLTEGQLARVVEGLERAPDVGPPPAASGLPQDVLDRVVPSTVKVEGVACRRIQEGSGFVVGADLVVTNAHVVAGEQETVLERTDGSEVRAEVVAFDPNRDLAVLRAEDVDRAALPLGDTDVGGTGAVFGHPGGGALRAAPFEVGREVRARGTDIYDRNSTERDVLVLASDLRPGDSGGALVDAEGRVVGVAFAIAPDRDGVAYALAISELEAVLAGDLSSAVDTGPCLQ
ncbi:MAG TPA: MarP family serine protease [Acidimicrobiales bacterium]|nr:MarP family serine protease [Acidimicrobiales bacterium]